MQMKKPDMDKPPIVAELERVFFVLNQDLFEGTINPVPVTIQPKKKVSLRYFPDAKAIVLGSDFPNLDYTDVPPTLLHEMIHIWNEQQGVVDCTTNQYHNKQFLSSALEMGLVVIKHKTQGWAITTTTLPRNVMTKELVRVPSKAAITRRNEVFAALKIDKAAFRQGRSEIRQRVKEEKPSKTYFLKYVCNCPPPHNSIRSGRRPDGPHALNIECKNCHSKFVCVSKLSDE